jgi:hypothetical protein
MMQKQSCVEDVLLPPLVAFGIFQIMVSDYHFMYAWGVVAFALATVKRVSLPSV